MAKNDEANDNRLIAAEIIRRLYAEGNAVQLELLKMQVERSLEEIRKQLPGKGADDA